MQANGEIAIENLGNPEPVKRHPMLDETGRFKKGNPGGGRLSREAKMYGPLMRSQMLRETIKRRLKQKDLNELADSIIEDAKEGNQEARSLLFGLLRD